METTKLSEAEAKRLIDTYADLILRLSYTYLKSTHDAEDLCQIVLLKLVNTCPHFESDQHEKAWIIRTSINACKDMLRSGFRKRQVNLSQADHCVAPEKPQGEVLEAVMALPRKYREALYLHYFEGYSIKEIAALTSRSEAAVSAHLSRGRNKLRTTLKGVYCERGL